MKNLFIIITILACSNLLSQKQYFPKINKDCIDSCYFGRGYFSKQDAYCKYTFDSKKKAEIFYKKLIEKFDNRFEMSNFVILDKIKIVDIGVLRLVCYRVNNKIILFWTIYDE